MLNRLGHVLGWTGNILAALTIAVAAIFFLERYPRLSDAERLSDLVNVGAGGIVALIFFLIGRALRYIFSGPSRSTYRGNKSDW